MKKLSIALLFALVMGIAACGQQQAPGAGGGAESQGMTGGTTSQSTVTPSTATPAPQGQ